MPNVANKEILIIDENSIKNKIYLMRCQRVMLDFDLAEIYGYETRKLNEQIKTNIKRFGPDFMFQLKKSEWESILRSKNRTAKTLSSKRRYLPYAFTEQGIYMLMFLRGVQYVKYNK